MSKRTATYLGPAPPPDAPLDAPVAERIRWLVARLSGDHARTGRVGGGLPIWADFSAWVVLRPTLDVVAVLHDSHEVLDPIHEDEESQQLERILAHVMAAERFSLLADLMPTRGPGDLDCERCHATGDEFARMDELARLPEEQARRLAGLRRRKGSRLPTFNCPRCGGLGWHVPERASAAPLP